MIRKKYIYINKVYIYKNCKIHFHIYCNLRTNDIIFYYLIKVMIYAKASSKNIIIN